MIMIIIIIMWLLLSLLIVIIWLVVVVVVVVVVGIISISSMISIISISIMIVVLERSVTTSLLISSSGARHPWLFMTRSCSATIGTPKGFVTKRRQKKAECLEYMLYKSGKDKGGPSKGGFLNYIWCSYTVLYLCNEVNGVNTNNILFMK